MGYNLGLQSVNVIVAATILHALEWCREVQDGDAKLLRILERALPGQRDCQSGLLSWQCAVVGYCGWWHLCTTCLGAMYGHDIPITHGCTDRVAAVTFLWPSGYISMRTSVVFGKWGEERCILQPGKKRRSYFEPSRVVRRGLC